MTVDVQDLAVTAGDVTVLAPTCLHLEPGRITAVTGPSGSGKSTLLRAIPADLAPGLTRTAGTVTVLGRDPFALSLRDRQEMRRTHLAYVGQDPGAALNPVMKVRTLLRDVARPTGEDALLDVLDCVRLPRSYLTRRPGELSGGEQRRVALARALVRQTAVLLVDEPLAGLDGPLRRDIAALLRELADQRGITIAVSGHDSAALTELADDVVSLGESAEPQPVSAIRHVTVASTSVLVTADRLSTPHVLRDIGLTIHEAETVGMIGASGAGKTTLARTLVGIEAHSGRLDLARSRLHPDARRRDRSQRREIQLVPQDPLSTLNPQRTVGQTVGRALALHHPLHTTRRHEGVVGLLAEVGLAADVANRRPGELSGGQRQRVAIARALAAQPRLLVCDEITSALDTATAEKIMSLLQRLRADRRLSILLISHDLRLVAQHCARTIVIHDGQIIEHGTTRTVFTSPAHPVTAELVAHHTQSCP